MNNLQEEIRCVYCDKVMGIATYPLDAGDTIIYHHKKCKKIMNSLGAKNERNKKGD